MKTKLLFAFFAISFLGFGQFNDMPSSGWDSTDACVGIIRDPGGASNYPSYSNGYYVIDPPGNENIQLNFTQFYTDLNSDYLYVYDGVGTSGTLLGSFSGTSIPNGGTPVVSTTGAITLRFYSNCCTQYSGFQATWSAVAGNAPLANFIPASNSVAYNTSLQFYNTTIYGGTYLWDFGDGTTSTAENPSHKFTSSGVFPVKLISSNCNSTDTSSVVNITVGSAPAGTLTPDTIKLSVACGGLANGSGMISNGSGAGNLNYSLSFVDLSVPIALFESFESGLGNFTNQNPSIYTTSNITSAGSPHGNKYMNFVGNGYLFDGLEANIAPTQPGNISYSVRTNLASSSTNGHFGVGPAGTSYYSDEMFYSYITGSNLVLVYRVGGSYNYYYHTISANTWYNVSIENINYSAKTFDVYIDGTKVVTAGQFINQTLTSVSDVHIFNYYYGDVAFDNISIGGKTLNNQTTFLPTSGTVSAGGNNNIAVSINTTGKPAGVYNLGFLIASNDTALDGKIYPIELEITGDPILASDITCIDAGTLILGQSFSDSVLIYNTGCAAFGITNASNDSSAFAFSNYLQTVASDDSIYFDVNFTPTAKGVYNDTLHLYNATDTFSICLTAEVNGSPDLALDTSFVNAATINCGDVDTITRVLYNNGDGPLSYKLQRPQNPTLLDVKNAFVNNATNLLSKVSTPFLFTDGESGSYIIDGGSDMYDNGNYLNTSYYYNLPYTQGVISNQGFGTSGAYFTYKIPGFFLMAADLDNVYEFYTSGGLGQDGLGLSTTSAVAATVAGKNFKGFIRKVYGATNPSIFQLIIFEADGSVVQNATTSTNSDYHSVSNLNGVNRIYYLLFSRTLGGNMNNSSIKAVMEEFLKSVYASGTEEYVTMVPDSGSVAIGDSVSLDILFNSNGLTTGTYSGDVVINTNQPGYPFVNIPYDFVVSGSPELTLDQTCLTLDSTLVGGAVGDSIWLYNTGCEDMVITSVTSSSGAGTLSSTAFTIPAFDSSKVYVEFTPLSNGLTSDTLTLVGNVTDAKICMSSYADNAPTVVVDTSLISNFVVNCNDSVLNNFTLYNTGLGDLDYEIGGSKKFINILAITHGADMFTEYPNTISAIQSFSTLPVYITQFSGTSASALNTALQSTDVILITEMEGSTAGFTNLYSTIQNFVNSGGGIVFAGSSNSSKIASFGIFTGLGSSNSNQSCTVNSSYAADPAVAGIPTSFVGPNATYSHSFSNAKKKNYIYSSSTTYEVFTEVEYGRGKAIYVGFDFYSTNTYSSTLIARAVNMASQTGSLPSWASIDPDSSNTVVLGDSVNFDLWFHSKGLASGTYVDTLVIITNDPENPSVKIPLEFTVSGSPEFGTSLTSCLDFDTNFVGYPVVDSIYVFNYGCDSLVITGSSNTTGQYSVAPAAFTLAPEDSILVEVTYSPIAAGLHNDTIVFAGNDSTALICIEGYAKDVPSASVSPTSFSISGNGCGGLVWDTITLTNSGLGSLDYEVIESTTYSGSSQIVYTVNGASTVHSFSGISTLSDTALVSVILNGDFDSGSEYASLYIDGVFISTIADNNLYATDDSIAFYIYGPQLTTFLLDGTLDVTVTNNYSVDPYSGANNYHRVNVQANGGSSPWLSIGTPSSGNLATSSTVQIPVSFDPTGLADSTYTTNIYVATDDPSNPLIVIPVDFTVFKFPTFDTNAPCISFGSVDLSTPETDSIQITNNGCGDLIISQVQFTSGIFSTTYVPDTIAAGASVWVPITVTPISIGSFSDNVNFTTNIGVISKCLTGIVATVPSANFSTVNSDPCSGTVTITDLSANSPSFWNWDFGDGNTSTVQNPTHTYTKPGVYSVRLIVSNSSGSDTIVKTVAFPVLLYGAFEAPAQAMTGIDVQFIDSSQVATSWQWFFGDGSTAVVQNPIHKYNTPGIYNVTLVVNNGTCSKTINKQIEVGNDIGVDEFASYGFVVYPNPSNNIVNLSSDIDREYSLEVFDAQGKLIYQGRYIKELTVLVDKWPTGLYTFRVNDELGNFKSYRIVVE